MDTAGNAKLATGASAVGTVWKGAVVIGRYVKDTRRRQQVATGQRGRHARLPANFSTKLSAAGVTGLT